MNELANIATFNLSTNLSLNSRLNELDTQFSNAATQNITELLDGDGTYTEPERQAMISFEKLKLIGGLGLAEIILRGKVLDDIETMGRWSVLPGSYQSLDDAAKAQGIGASTLSNIKDLPASSSLI